MSSPVSKPIQTQNLEQTNLDQNEAHEDQTQNLEPTNHDQNEAHGDQAQNQEETNCDQNEAHGDQAQNQEEKNRDQEEKIQCLEEKIHELQNKNQEVVDKNRDLQKENLELTAKIKEYRNKIQDLEQQTNCDQNEAHGDQAQNLEPTNRDQNEAHGDQAQNQEEVLSAQFENLNVNDYSQINPSPVKVDTSQPCTIWWCPVHSNFATNYNRYKPTTDADRLIVRRARDRFNYWNNQDDGERCCFCQRKNRDSNKYSPPSNWPR